MVTANPVCFAAGTLIRTTRGDVRIEALHVGDRVVTAAGTARPIRWLGHRVIDCGRHPRPNEVLPVRIAAHAFGEGRPARDLLVSPGHAICVDVGGEVLIPALSLANGTTITRAVVDTVAYWHVELDSHDIILAEGLPSESYLEMGNRSFFAENPIVRIGDVSPDGDRSAPRTHADFCRPFQAAGPIVDAARGTLAARAATYDRRAGRFSKPG